MSPKRACDWEMLLAIESNLEMLPRDYKLSRGAAESIKRITQAVHTIMYGPNTTPATRDRMRGVVWAKIAEEAKKDE